MKIRTLVVTLLFAIGMWAQNVAPAAPATPGSNQAASCCKDGATCCKSGAACCQGKDAASCCKKGASCCKEGAVCCGKDNMAKADCCKEGAECCKAGAQCCSKMAKNTEGKGCCGGKMCKRHQAEKS